MVGDCVKGSSRLCFGVFEVAFVNQAERSLCILSWVPFGDCTPTRGLSMSSTA